MKKIALIFPGQGSQSVGMMASFSESRAVRDVFVEASEAIGQDLWKLAEKGPAEALNSTVNTQPVMLTAGYAVYRAWLEARGPEPAIVAGHSLGEYTALTAAGVIALRDAVPLVRFRAQAMQEAVPIGVGAMAAVLGLDDDSVRAACRDASQGEIVEAVNFNAPSQVVIAGHKTAVERAAASSKERGAKRAVMLPVSAPFHSSLLSPAADRLREYLQRLTFQAPRMPVVNNVDAALTDEPSRIVDVLARQARSPVRWVEVVRRIAAEGVIDVIECGPGKVLSGFTKRIEPTLQSYSASDRDSLLRTLEALR
jgi:[acyl-carrier-protein] S-malonyltransferase